MNKVVQVVVTKTIEITNESYVNMTDDEIKSMFIKDFRNGDIDDWNWNNQVINAVNISCDNKVLERPENLRDILANMRWGEFIAYKHLTIQFSKGKFLVSLGLGYPITFKTKSLKSLLKHLEEVHKI